MTRISFLIPAAGLTFTLFAQAEFSTQCSNVQYDTSGWIYGDCATGSGSETAKAALFLNDKLSNSNGQLQWYANGNYLTHCQDCALVGSNNLTCSCQNAGSSSYSETWLDLDEQITLTSGSLHSNFAQTPALPTLSKYAAFPTAFNYEIDLGDLVLCSINKTDGDCYLNPAYTAAPSTGTCTDTSSGYNPIKSTGYVACKDFPMPIDSVYAMFESFGLKTPDDGTWEIVLYPDQKCAGTVILTIDSASAGNCKALSTYAQAYSIRPLFNAGN